MPLKMLLKTFRICMSYNVHTHTLFKNTQQMCMNKMQMTITKEKKITTYT